MRRSTKTVRIAVFCCAAAACNTQVTVGSRYVKSQLVRALTGGSVVVTSADGPTLAGTAVEIPPNALSKDTVITIAEASPLALPTGATAAGPVAELGPADATFAQPITIVVPCHLSSGQGAAGLTIQGRDPDGTIIRVSGADLTIDAAAGVVTFTASRLITFGCVFSSTSDPTATGGGSGGTTATGGGSGGGTTATGGGSGGGEPIRGDAGTYGEPTGDSPSWEERVVLLMTNAVRVDPAGYKASYGSDFQPAMGPNVLTSTYPAVAPVHLNAALGQSARFHSEDMATNGCFQLASCDGTSMRRRVASYYDLSTMLAENFSRGLTDPRQAVNQWLCAPNGSCCVDGAGCDVPRTIIMDSAFEALGVGRASPSTSAYGPYWTQDFGGAAATPAPPLVDGSHLFYPSQSTTFAATFASSNPPMSVSVVIDGATTPLSLALGTPTSGHWAVRTDTAGACRSYYFEAVDAQGVTWRYPAHGVLRTTGEGGCTESFSP